MEIEKNVCMWCVISTITVYTIANGDNHIEVIENHILYLSFPFHRFCRVVCAIFAQVASRSNSSTL